MQTHTRYYGVTSMMVPMDIKIGFTESPRELVINLDSEQDQVVAQIAATLNNNDGTVDLTDSKGRRYLVRSAQIAYVEVGTSTHRSVGFAGV